MTESDGWLQRFETSYRELTSPAAYWTAAPMVVLGLVALLWSLPVPDEFEAISPLLNWATAFLMAAVIYYFIISVSLAIGLLPLVVAIAAANAWVGAAGLSHARLSLGLLVAGMIGLWLGRRGNSGFRLFIGDLQHVMLAPAWLLSTLFKRFGIPL